MALNAETFADSQNFVRNFMPYLDRTGSPAHSVVELVRYMTDNVPNAKKLEPYGEWKLERGSTYYLSDANATMMAFHVGTNFHPETGGLLLAIGHTDSPALKLEYKCDSTAHAFNQSVCLTYTTGLWHTWLDRDLGLAGRVIVRNNGLLEEKLVHISKPLIVVPNLSIHLQNQDERCVLKINRERHLRGVVATEAVQKLNSESSKPILEYIAKHLNVSMEDIVDMDLCLMDNAPSALSGLYEEFLSSARLDNLASCFGIMGGLIDFVNGKDVANSAYLSCTIYYNYEEMGSKMASGADSNVTIEWLEKMYASLGTSLKESKERIILLNVDMSHAVHPNYSDRHPDTHTPHFHEGLVVKRNMNGRYATDLRAAAIVMDTARDCGVPVQHFRVSNDAPCGSTVGPFLSSRLCVPVVDVGIPQLAMHSIREICSIVDIWHLKEVVKGLFKNSDVFKHYKGDERTAGTVTTTMNNFNVLGGLEHVIEVQPICFAAKSFFRARSSDLTAKLFNKEG